LFIHHSTRIVNDDAEAVPVAAEKKRLVKVQYA